MGFFTVVGIIVCCIAGIAAAVATCVLTYCFVKEPLTSFAERLKRRFGGRPRVTVELRNDGQPPTTKVEGLHRAGAPGEQAQADQPE